MERFSASPIETAAAIRVPPETAVLVCDVLIVLAPASPMTIAPVANMIAIARRCVTVAPISAPSRSTTISPRLVQIVGEGLDVVSSQHDRCGFPLSADRPDQAQVGREQ
jgi:hypothetical protein